MTTNIALTVTPKVLVEHFVAAHILYRHCLRAGPPVSYFTRHSSALTTIGLCGKNGKVLKSSQVAFNKNELQSHKYYQLIDINENKIV